MKYSRTIEDLTSRLNIIHFQSIRGSVISACELQCLWMPSLAPNNPAPAMTIRLLQVWLNPPLTTLQSHRNGPKP